MLRNPVILNGHQITKFTIIWKLPKIKCISMSAVTSASGIQCRLFQVLMLDHKISFKLCRYYLTVTSMWHHIGVLTNSSYYTHCAIEYRLYIIVVGFQLILFWQYHEVDWGMLSSCYQALSVPSVALAHDENLSLCVYTVLNSSPLSIREWHQANVITDLLAESSNKQVMWDWLYAFCS